MAVLKTMLGCVISLANSNGSAVFGKPTFRFIAFHLLLLQRYILVVVCYSSVLESKCTGQMSAASTRDRNAIASQSCNWRDSFTLLYIIMLTRTPPRRPTPYLIVKEQPKKFKYLPTLSCSNWVALTKSQNKEVNKIRKEYTHVNVYFGRILTGKNK